jgi:hypothetical protein
MNSQNFTRKTRIAGMSALGLAVGLALSACNASGSSAGATATSTAATPQASATTATTGPTPTDTPGNSSTGGSGTGGQSLVLANCEGQPVVRPTTYRFGCFDALNTMKDLQWTTWGQTATATGIEELNSCVPDCAPSRTTDYPVSIQLSGSGSRVTSSGTLHVYLYVTITYSGTMPTLQPGEAAGVVTQTNANSRTIEMDTSR